MLYVRVYFLRVVKDFRFCLVRFMSVSNVFLFFVLGMIFLGKVGFNVWVIGIEVNRFFFKFFKGVRCDDLIYIVK